MHIWPPTDFCGFGLEHAVPIHPIFEPCPLNGNVARWCNGQFITFVSSRVHWSGSLSIYVFKRSSSNSDGSPECGVSLMSKRSSSKTRKPYSCHALSNGIVFIHGENVSGRLHCFHPSIELKEKEFVGNVPIFTLGTLPVRQMSGSFRPQGPRI